MREQTIQAILEHKIIAIVRGVDAESIVPTAQALYEGGIRLVEVTFNQKDPSSFHKTAEAVRAIREAMGDKMLVGTGTVTSPELVEMSAEAGALYIISPDTDVAVIRRTRELGLVSLPGAYTATEAKQAHNAGADFVKLFPCIEGAPAYVKALSAPFNHIKFLAVGGVNADNAATFLRSGAVGVGVGSCLVNKKWAAEGRYDLITAEAKKFVENIKNA
jgi:2-dehydro-3-deoxyphosphogluconate aldolase/(4S)-4-hydroxy-2-oxoglutarate aldolase